VRRGVVVLHDAFGRLGPEDDAPRLPGDAIYPIASLTKPITATCVMCLVEDGVLGLNRPVQEYVPEFAGEGKQAVMVHHLLTHTSGITPEGIEAHATAKVASGELPLEERGYPVGIPLAFCCFPEVYDAPLARPPGTEMSYLNLGYGLLADIVGRVAGKPAEQFAAERVLEPLGMDDTRFAGIGSGRSRYVRRAADDPFAFLNEVDRVGRVWPGAAGATSTARDVAAFGQMFLNRGRYGGALVLSPASVAAMTRDQAPGIGASYGAERFSQAGWGFGWGIQLDKTAVNYPTLVSRRMFEHSGAGGAAILIDPEHEMVLVYLSVLTGGEVGGIPSWCFDLFANAAAAAIVD
jgi:CubicO group peptidase (beta-lactamase class C family)